MSAPYPVHLRVLDIYIAITSSINMISSLVTAISLLVRNLNMIKVPGKLVKNASSDSVGPGWGPVFYKSISISVPR